MTEEQARLVVAIDGPSGVGKTTVAQRVAGELGVPYLETGAMYRAVALDLLDRGVDPTDRAAVEEALADLPLDLQLNADQGLDVWLRGEPVGDRIRGLEVAQTTSKISTYPAVREAMVALQRRAAEQYGGVLEGRDIGTKVFPGTPHKFFLDADVDVRAERRWKQLLEHGKVDLGLDEVRREVRERDQRDRNRAESPLRCDDSYTRIDTGAESVDRVVKKIVAEVRAATDSTATSRSDGSR